MNKEEKLFFHMAAMFYNSKTQNVKRDNVIKKIIENTMCVNGNKSYTCPQLSAEIYNTAGMLVSEEEIKTIVTNPSNGHFEVDYSANELIIRLSGKRYNYLNNINEKNMDYYVNEFIKSKGYDQQIGEIINKFIYEFYCRNVNDLNNILKGNHEIEIDTTEMSPEENVIIQEFIEWDNVEKDKMFHALANSALEYLLISGDINLLKRRDIRSAFVGKKIYIDTNILFYCMGINGKEFEIANKAFLKKCLECKEEIIISYYTERELEATISHFVKEIKRIKSPMMYSQDVFEWITSKDVYAYYLNWCKGQKNLTDAKCFEQYLMKKYEDLIKDYSITVEKKVPFNEEELEQNEKFVDYNTQIITNSVINYDARNIFLIEAKRTSVETSLQNTKTIFVSADKSLQRWDSARKHETPVVIAPNLWLLLLSRLVSRSDDDYKCFMSYINMVNVEQVISNKEYLEVIKVINDIVEDIQQQESVIKVMIEEEFSFLENNGEKRSAEFIIDKTTAETNRILTEQVAELKEELSESNTRLNKAETMISEILTNQEQLNDNIRREAYEDSLKLEQENIDLKDKNGVLEQENEKLKNIIRKGKIIFRRLLCIIVICILTFPVAYELVDVFCVKNPNPISWRVVNNALRGSVCEPENIVETYLSIIYLTSIFIVGTLDVLIIKWFWNPRVRIKEEK